MPRGFYGNGVNCPGKCSGSGSDGSDVSTCRLVCQKVMRKTRAKALNMPSVILLGNAKRSFIVSQSGHAF